MTAAIAPHRCRIVLIAPPDLEPDALQAALSGGDVASLIVPAYGRDTDGLQSAAQPLVEIAQAADVAAIIAGEARVASRLKADGVHIEKGRTALVEAIEHHRGAIIVGAGGATSRDDALDLGEARPDYVFFGRFGFDDKPAPHPRNLALGQWWAQMIEIPCIVQGGSDPESAAEVAATGAEFVALGSAIFGGGLAPAAAVRRANALLDASTSALEA